MAWVGDHLFSYAQAMVAGFTINCPESGDTVMTDLREIGPTYYFAPPRVFENLLTQVMIRMEDASADQARAVPPLHGGRDGAAAPRSSTASRSRSPIGCSTALGNLLVYGPLRNVLGMSRIRVAYTAGAAIGPDLFRFYRSIGVNLKQLYGSTETCAYVCLQPDGGVKFDTRRHAGARRRGEDRRHRARCWCAGRCCSRNTTSGPMRRRSRSTPKATSTPATPAVRRRRAAQDHRPREGRRQARGRRDVRAQLHREQAQVLPAHQGSGGVRPRPRHGVRVRQHRRGIGRQLGRAPRPRRTRATPTSRRSPRSTS